MNLFYCSLLRPVSSLQYGIELDVVAYKEGKLVSVPGEDTIRLVNQRICMHISHIGQFVPKTTNTFTRPGGVELVNESEEQLERDYAAIHALDAYDLFEFGDIANRPIKSQKATPTKGS